jgi:hypothetical protein
MSDPLLGQVYSAKHNGWRNFVTLDESWFYCHTDCESTWPSGNEKASDRERRMAASPKLMFMVVWKPAGFHVVEVLIMGMKFCSAYCLSHIMDLLLASLQPDQPHPFRRLLSMGITVVPTNQKRWMNASRVTTSGGPIIRRIHQIWHLQISFCLDSLRDS